MEGMYSNKVIFTLFLHLRIEEMTIKKTKANDLMLATMSLYKYCLNNNIDFHFDHAVKKNKFFITAHNEEQYQKLLEIIDGNFYIKKSRYIGKDIEEE